MTIQRVRFLNNYRQEVLEKTEGIIKNGNPDHLGHMIPYFLDRGLLLTRKLLNQGFLLAKLKSSLRKLCGRHHDLVDLSSFMTYHRVCNQINTTGATSGAGTAYPSGASEFTPFLVGFVLLDLQLYVYVLQIVVCPFVLFHLAIVLSVLLRYTASD